MSSACQRELVFTSCSPKYYGWWGLGSAGDPSAVTSGSALFGNQKVMILKIHIIRTQAGGNAAYILNGWSLMNSPIYGRHKIYSFHCTVKRV